MLIKKYIFILAFFLSLTMPLVAQTHHVDVDVDDVSSSTMIIDGIDVSDHQKVIDWEALATDKRIKYVYIKATEGSSFKSPSYRRNVEGAKRVGIKVGSYHFMRTGTRIQDQFENFTSMVKKNEQDLLPLLDVETKKGWTNEQLRDSVRLFLNLLEEHYGVRPMIYTNAYYYNNLLGGEFADYPLFIARFAANEPVLTNAKWILWQFSEKGRLPGINHAVDLSRFNKGCGLKDIAMKGTKIKSRRRSATDAVDKKDKPGRVNVRSKEPPAMSKQQEKEMKKQQEKERKARERAEKMAADEAKKQAEAKKKKEEADKKRKQQEAHEQARKKQEAEKKQKEQERIKKQQEADLKQKAKEADERRKAKEAEDRRKAQEAERAKKEQEKQARENRLKQQQEKQQQVKTEQKQKLQQQKQNAQTRTKTTTNVRQSTKSRTNKSSADND